MFETSDLPLKAELLAYGNAPTNARGGDATASRAPAPNFAKPPNRHAKVRTDRDLIAAS